MRRLSSTATVLCLYAAAACAQAPAGSYELALWVVRGPALASLGASRPAPSHLTVATWARGAPPRLALDVAVEGEHHAHAPDATVEGGHVRFRLAGRALRGPLARWSRLSDRAAVVSARSADSNRLSIWVGHGGPVVSAAPPGIHDLFFADRGMIHHVRIEGTAPSEWQPTEGAWSGSGQAFLERALLTELRRRGLRAAEARALLDTWREHLVPADDQIRVVRMIPQDELDALVTVRATPAARRVIRVGLEIYVLGNAIPFFREPEPAPRPDQP